MEIVCLPLTLRELSHELRTPLTGILGAAQLLKDELLTAEQRSFVEDIINEGNKLVKLSDDLLKARSLAKTLEMIAYPNCIT